MSSHAVGAEHNNLLWCHDLRRPTLMTVVNSRYSVCVPKAAKPPAVPCFPGNAMPAIRHVGLPVEVMVPAKPMHRNAHSSLTRRRRSFDTMACRRQHLKWPCKITCEHVTFDAWRVTLSTGFRPSIEHCSQTRAGIMRESIFSALVLSGCLYGSANIQMNSNFTGLSL